ncbi:MAG: peptide deformylase [Granulosicoccus sp.]
MAQLDIVEYPDPVLRQVAKPVSVFDAALQELTDNLTDTLYCTSGIGLCAPQIGYSQQLLVMDLSEDQTKLEVFINPKILSKSGFAIAEERCLSIPGVAAKVIRAGVVQISAQNIQGQTFEQTLEGMSAICMQHEIDHLQGTLFIDRVSRLRGLLFKRALRSLDVKHARATVQTV